MLQEDDLNAGAVQVICCLLISCNVILRDNVGDGIGIGVIATPVLHGDQVPFCSGKTGAKTIEGIAGKRGDPAFARREVADHRCPPQSRLGDFGDDRLKVANNRRR